MPVDVFFDTNIFVYTFDASAPEKRRRARSLVREALEKGTGAISWQVAQEFLNVGLHKFENPFTAGEASDYLDQVLLPLWKVSASPELFHEAILIQRQAQYRFHDSLIVASAVHSGASTLYSEDLQAGRTFGKTKIVNPFA
ncbi:MAG: PIN domain-containing protein [Terrimicrobiaceae bacterium]|nr:PIN domain-containing protein [Terrimicrobiaceae bacterium]